MNDDLTFNARVQEVVKDYMQSAAFSDRKVTDTPTDALGTVNRKYVTMNGTSTARPTASVVGQSYFDTTIGKPCWWSGTAFVDANGNVV